MKPLDEFATRWTAVNISVPFVDTVNVQVDTDELPDVWGSARLQGETRQDVTLGSNPHVDERGSIVVGLFARSGSGRNVLDVAVGEIRTAFHGYVTPDYELQYLMVEGPLEVDTETDGEWWRVALNVPYLMQTRRVEPVA